MIRKKCDSVRLCTSLPNAKNKLQSHLTFPSYPFRRNGSRPDPELRIVHVKWDNHQFEDVKHEAHSFVRGSSKVKTHFSLKRGMSQQTLTLCAANRREEECKKQIVVNDTEEDQIQIQLNVKGVHAA